jgi:mono/diheme cytochrome c family protein
VGIVNIAAKLKIALAITSGLMSFLVSCHSSDLGSVKPDRIPVNLSLTGWDSGAGMVIAQKCANCHTSQRSEFVPANTPHDLDGIGSFEFFKNPENRGIVRGMRKRIASIDADKQMPPRFATPLYEDEKAVVLEFLNAVESGQPTIPPDPVDPTPPAKLTFNDIAPIVTKHCAGCHRDGGRLVRLTTREDFLDLSPLPLEEISAGSMPKRYSGNPPWKKTAEGKLVIQWLQGSQAE